MFNNMNDMPSPFMGMPMMFPFMQGMNNTADANAQQTNCFPFSCGNMQQMMFPFFMQGTNNAPDAANGQQANGFPFPFGMMPQMPQMMFPFNMQGMNNTPDTANGQQVNSVPFPFGMIPNMPKMPMMMFPFIMQGMKNNAGKEETSEQDGFSFMGITIPKSMLQKLLNMDWAPEELDKLQKIIDMIYAMMPKK